MLFHLNEPDYEKEVQNAIVTRFYGRNSQQILTALDYYEERVRKDGQENNPNLAWWLKRKFSARDIKQVKKGEFWFITGMISIAEEDQSRDLFDVELKVSDDFSVYVPNENIGYFALWRKDIMEKERGGLYKLQNPTELFMNLSFVPEDIARAIRDFDLTPYRGVVERDMARREKLSRNPHVKLDSLQRLLEGQPRKITLSNQN